MAFVLYEVPAPEEVSIVSIAMESFCLTWRFPFTLMTMFEVRLFIIYSLFIIALFMKKECQIKLHHQVPE